MSMPAASKSPQDTAALVARYRAPLMSYFLRRVGDRSDAEDLTQEVFARIVRREGADTLDVADGLIFAIAANLLKDRRRRATVRQASAHVSLEAESEALGGKPGFVEDLSPERVLIGKEKLSSVLGSLNAMPRLTRDIFLMYRLEGVKQREIAVLFGISLSTVEKHLRRALTHLAESAGWAP